MQLIEQYPHWYADIPEFVALQAAYSALDDEDALRWKNVLAQCNLDTATWGLDLWEDRLSLPVAPPLGYEARRALIRARLRGGGPINAAYLSQLASQIVGEPVGAVEHNTESYVEFGWGHPGYPANYNQLIATINDVIPAHLEPVFAAFWARWIDIHTGKLTMGQISAMTWAQVHTYEPPTEEGTT